MANVHVMDAVLVSLFVQEVKHVLDCEWQSTTPADGAEQSLKQVIDKLLQRTLTKHHSNVKSTPYRWNIPTEYVIAKMLWERVR